MRIAYLNPWQQAAENQAFRSLQEAAHRLGHELVHCANSDDVEIQRPDFVLATASTQPKLNDCPHYGTIHEPRDRFLDSREYFTNLLTYDGYLTIADTLARFLRDLLHGIGRTEDIGEYYNSPQRQTLVTHLDELIRLRRLVITYFGTNWDKRREDFFRRLSLHDGVQICGPAHSWPHIEQKSYGGAPAFDGSAVQARYAANGIGLCLLSDLHLRDDVISNRLFEIASVGAVAICCDMPWIRTRFGDTVFYVDQSLPDDELVAAVLERRDEVYRDPAGARLRAEAARRIFEEQYSAEVLLANAVQYHERRMARRSVALDAARRRYEPLVSIIVRCGGRPLSMLATALRSIHAQTYGRFEILLVRYQPLDVGPLLESHPPNVLSIRVIDSFDGDRSTTLWAGLRAASGEYVAVLDDDDWFFRDHFERLFQPWPVKPLSRFLAFTGSVTEHLEPQQIMGGGDDRRTLTRFGAEGDDLLSIASAIASNAFVASTDLLHPALLDDPQLSTAEDSYLVLSLIAQTTPRFTYAATSAHLRGAPGQSHYVHHSSRFDDELALRMRVFARATPTGWIGSYWGLLHQLWNRRLELQVRRTAAEVHRDSHDRIVHRGAPALSPPDGETFELVREGFDGPVLCAGGSRVEDAVRGAAFLQCPGDPTDPALRLELSADSADTPQLFVMELVVDRGDIAVTLSEAGAQEQICHLRLRSDPRVHEVRLPLTAGHTRYTVTMAAGTAGVLAMGRLLSLSRHRVADVSADASLVVPSSAGDAATW